MQAQKALEYAPNDINSAIVVGSGLGKMTDSFDRLMSLTNESVKRP